MHNFTNTENLLYNDYMTKAFKTIYTLLNRLEKSLDYEEKTFDAEEQIGYEALGITGTRWRCYKETMSVLLGASCNTLQVQMLAQKNSYTQNEDLLFFL